VAEPWLSADDIAAHLGVTKDTVYTWIAEKAMPAHKVGRLWKFQASEIDDWVRAGAAASDHEAPQGVPPMSVAAPTIVTTTGTGRGDDDAE
jgi:excisionase family DNA binding protein